MSQPAEKVRTPFDKYIPSIVEGLRVSGLDLLETNRLPLMLSPSTSLRTCLSKHWVGVFDGLLGAGSFRVATSRLPDPAWKETRTQSASRYRALALGVWAVAIEAPRLSQLLDRARLVVAATVDEVTAYDDGRLAVARLRVRAAIKGTPPHGEVHVIEMRNLPVPPAFVVGDHVLTFLQPATRNSYLDHRLPDGRYFEPVRGYGAVLKGSAAAVARSASLVKRMVVPVDPGITPTPCHHA